MQRTAGACAGRKQRVLKFGLLVSYWLQLAAFCFFFSGARCARLGVRSTEIVGATLN